MNSKQWGKAIITSNNESVQIMKLTHRIHVCLIVFLIHYFDIINWLKSDKVRYILIQQWITHIMNRQAWLGHVTDI